VTEGIAVKNRVIAVLVGMSLLVAATSTTFAAGKLGGSGGADEFRRPRAELVQGGKIGAGMDGPTTRGSKLGIDPGKD
jgi:hypothetical protein